MSHQIVAYINTEPQPETGYYLTQFHWDAPRPGDDAESFIHLMTTRFATELRRTIEATE